MTPGAVKARLKRALQRGFYRGLFAAERTCDPTLPTMADEAAARAAAQSLRGRICVVKQDVYNDLYCCAPGTDWPGMIRSSLKRSGPVALFSELGADFRILRTEESPECSVWKQKVHDCRQNSIEHYYRLQTYANPYGENRHVYGQGQFAVAAAEVDWSRYDVVLSLDVAVPAAVTSRHPGTVWAYWISEPCMRTYRASHFAPMNGYDLFLNQRFWEGRLAWRQRHELNFPYAFLKAGCLRSLAPDQERAGTMVESHTKHLLTPQQYAELERFGPVRLIGGTISEIIDGLHFSKYWVRLGGRSLWGNGMAEAIACGCVALGNPAEFKNRSLFTRGTCAASFGEVVAAIREFEEDASLYTMEQREQQRRLDYYCYGRPASQLAAAMNEIYRRPGRKGGGS